MNRIHLKLIACAAMLADHVGYLLLPQYVFLRYIGRLAMPLFAFFIGEGCIYTSNRKKYFLSVAVLGLICQFVYFAEELLSAGRITSSSDAWYFNILFTFAIAAVGGFLLRDLITAVEKRERIFSRTVLLALFLVISGGVTLLFYKLREKGCSFYLDYGMCGILLPMSAALFKDKTKKLISFSVMLVIYCAVFMKSTPYVWFSLLCVPLLIFYNGKPGTPKLKYFFYVFYPAHLAALYLIDIFI